MYPLVLISECDTDVGIEQGGFEIDHLLVKLHCSLKPFQVVEDVSVAHIQGVTLHLSQHLLVPLQTFPQLVVRLVL